MSRPPRREPGRRGAAPCPDARTLELLRRDWAFRVLDEWARLYLGSRPMALARSAFSRLPADSRAKLGECP